MYIDRQSASCLTVDQSGNIYLFPDKTIDWHWFVNKQQCQSNVTNPAKKILKPGMCTAPDMMGQLWEKWIDPYTYIIPGNVEIAKEVMSF